MKSEIVLCILLSESEVPDSEVSANELLQDTREEEDTDAGTGIDEAGLVVIREAPSTSSHESSAVLSTPHAKSSATKVKPSNERPEWVTRRRPNITDTDLTILDIERRRLAVEKERLAVEKEKLKRLDEMVKILSRQQSVQNPTADRFSFETDSGQTSYSLR